MVWCGVVGEEAQRACVMAVCAAYVCEYTREWMDGWIRACVVDTGTPPCEIRMSYVRVSEREGKGGGTTPAINE